MYYLYEPNIHLLKNVSGSSYIKQRPTRCTLITYEELNRQFPGCWIEQSADIWRFTRSPDQILNLSLPGIIKAKLFAYITSPENIWSYIKNRMRQYL